MCRSRRPAHLKELTVDLASAAKAIGATFVRGSVHALHANYAEYTGPVHRGAGATRFGAYETLCRAC